MGTITKTQAQSRVPAAQITRVCGKTTGSSWVRKDPRTSFLRNSYSRSCDPESCHASPPKHKLDPQRLSKALGITGFRRYLAPDLVGRSGGTA